MRCPKCQYISFESGDRCRNCGYELSLSADEAPIDVTIGRDEPPPGRVDDVAFDAPLSSRGAGEALDGAGDLAAANDTFSPAVAADLPLFTERLGIADDQAPLVTPPAIPRQPLSVRRANPGARPRPRNPQPEELPLDLQGERHADRPRERAAAAQAAGATNAAAGVVRRFVAGLIDALILASIHATVFYLTLRACELTPEQWQVLPLIPLLAFMLLLCGGYFVLFTVAGGQTVGKMATGIRVVAAPSADGGGLRVSFSAAVMRAIACLGSVVFAGAGFLPILFTADRRAFHDRVAETRVVIA